VSGGEERFKGSGSGWGKIKEKMKEKRFNTETRRPQRKERKEREKRFNTEETEKRVREKYNEGNRRAPRSRGFFDRT